MKLHYVLALFGLTTNAALAQTTYFQQDFSTGEPLSRYSSSTPNSAQFNGISGASATIVNGTLQFDRTINGTTGHFSRTTDFSPVPTSLYVQFDFEVVSTTTVAGTSALVFYVGNAFANGVTSPANADTYARFGINFTGTGQEFSVRHIAPGGSGSFNSGVFTGKQTITFVLNNTGIAITYLRPGGGTKVLPNDTYDLWVGSAQVVNQLPVLTPTQALTDFKLRIDDGIYGAVFQFDNFLIRDISDVLPLTLTRFSGEARGPHIHLNWQTSTNTDTDRFMVERRTETGEFSRLSTLPGNPQHAYDFVDEQPLAGPNYYRLSHVDEDGLWERSKLIQVRYEPNQPALIVLNNPTRPDAIELRTYAFEGPTYRLTTLTGQSVACRQDEPINGTVTLRPESALMPGVYLLTVGDSINRLTRRILVR